MSSTVGESCLKDPTFNISDFTVSLWPIYMNQQYTFTMSGNFLHKELVDQLTIGVRKGTGAWAYTFDVLNQDYPLGNVTSFTYPTQGPSSKGSYTTQVTLHRPNYTIISCWQYVYVVTD